MRLIILFLLLCLSHLKGQDAVLKNAMRPINNIGLNIGEGSAIALIYERIKDLDGKSFLAGKIGIGYNEEFKICVFGPCSSAKQFTIFPTSVSANLGNSKNYLELGLGHIYVSGKTNRPSAFYILGGYRFQPLDRNKFNFRVYFSIPFSGYDNLELLFLPIGFSVGLCF